MGRRTLVALALVLALGAVAAVAGATKGGDRSNALKRQIDDGRAQNVILLIGDGMGDSEITIARNYTVGAGGRLAIDDFPFTGQMTTYSVLADGTPDYDSESASTSTAWSTGQKTVDGRISTSRTDQDLATILELAQKAGYKTGNVTTAELTDATPASPMSHVVARACQGPADMASCPQDRKSAGGPGSIAEQAVEHGVDVLLGGGKARFDQTVTEGPYAGQTVLQEAQALGYGVATDLAGLQAAPKGTKLLGLFTPVNMSLDWGGLAARNPSAGPGRCDTGLQPATEPTLADMTQKALQLLDPPNNRRKPGFFLQVEGASIDKRDHAAQPCEQIGETIDFDAAVKVALDFARKEGNTLVIVTADHAHTSQIVEVGATPAGASSILVTDEGGQMKVTYGTAAINPATGFPAGSQEHTGTQLRVAALGPQAANVVGLIDQTELFEIMARALNVD
jgi:alkaline phosphatase/streptomycin-6-phosphatase